MSSAIVPAAGEAGEVETAAQAEAAEDEGSESSPPSDEESQSNPYEENPKFNTRFNTPTKRASRSEVWNIVRRLGKDHPMEKDGYTHICTEAGCFHPLKLTKQNGNWSTSKAVTHLKDKHKDSKEGATYTKNSTEIQVTRARLCSLVHLS